MSDHLTPAMRTVLENLAAGRLAGAGLTGRSAMGGLQRTCAALKRRGLIMYQAALHSYCITDAGMSAIGLQVRT